MQLIPITNEAGAEIEVPAEQVSFAMKQPLERDWVLGLKGAIMKVNGAASPFDAVTKQMVDSDTEFEVVPIPEGNDAYIQKCTILFITSTGIDTSAIMFPGGAKCVVKEGINTLRARLTGKSVIVDG